VKSLLTCSTPGLLLWVCLAACPPAASAQSNIAGAWVVTINSPFGEANIDTTFTQTGEKIAGTVKGPSGAVDFSGTLIENELTVLYPLPLQGQMLEVRMTGAVEGEGMSGQVNLGGVAEATWTARRGPAAAGEAALVRAAPADSTGVSGRWSIALRLGAVSLPMVGTLVQDGEAVTGTIKTPVGDAPVTGRLTGTRLTLQFTAQGPQGAVPIALTAELTPRGLAGTASAVGLGASEWSATRAE
jgi:hypothetical protein